MESLLAHQLPRRKNLTTNNFNKSTFAATIDINNGSLCHVETVVLLSKNFSKPKEYVQIGVDAEDYYRIKDSEKK